MAEAVSKSALFIRNLSDILNASDAAASAIAQRALLYLQSSRLEAIYNAVRKPDANSAAEIAPRL